MQTENKLEDRNCRKCNLIVRKLPENSNDEDTFSSVARS